MEEKIKAMNEIQKTINQYSTKAVELMMQEHPEMTEIEAMTTVEDKINDYVYIIGNRADELSEKDNHKCYFYIYVAEAVEEQKKINGINWDVKKRTRKENIITLIIFTARTYINHFDWESHPFCIG